MSLGSIALALLEFLASFAPDALISWVLADDDRRGWLTAAIALLITVAIVVLILWAPQMPLWLAVGLGALIILAIAPVVSIYLHGHSK